MEIEFRDQERESVNVIVNEAQDILYLKGVQTGDNYLEIKLPFNISKIPPKYREPKQTHEYILLFKNRYISEYDVFELRKNGNRLGFIFKPYIIFENDSSFLYEEDKELKIAIFRSFIHLLNNTTTVKLKPKRINRATNFSFEDFYPRDIVVGVFPTDWVGELNEEDQTQILFNLYLSGFYLLKSENDLKFQTPELQLHKESLEQFQYQKKTYRKYFNLKEIPRKVKSNTYCSYYIKDLIKQNKNEIAKFHQLYGLVEIFKDTILKLEINEKLCSQEVINTEISGHKLRTEVLEISRDNYSITKLFTKYNENTSVNLDDLYLELMYFLETCREKSELDNMTNFPQIFYHLRNVIVHDIQFLFIGDDNKTEMIRETLSKIVLKLEYVIIETLTKIKI